MARARLNKARLKKLLQERNMAGIADLAAQQGGLLSRLFTLTYDSDPIVRHRAVEAVGKAAAEVAAHKGVERVRDFVRRLFWLTNDESGGLAWMAPQAIAEVLLNVPALIPEYGGLLANLLKEEPFVGGTAMALARLARKAPALVKENRQLLEKLARSRDEEARAGAMLALAAAGIDPDRRTTGGGEKVDIYDFESGDMKQVDLGTIFQAVKKQDRFCKPGNGRMKQRVQTGGSKS